jgi:hypothetical protein
VGGGSPPRAAPSCWALPTERQDRDGIAGGVAAGPRPPRRQAAAAGSTASCSGLRRGDWCGISTCRGVRPSGTADQDLADHRLRPKSAWSRPTGTEPGSTPHLARRRSRSAGQRRGRRAIQPTQSRRRRRVQLASSRRRQGQAVPIRSSWCAIKTPKRLIGRWSARTPGSCGPHGSHGPWPAATEPFADIPPARPLTFPCALHTPPLHARVHSIWSAVGDRVLELFGLPRRCGQHLAIADSCRITASRSVDDVRCDRGPLQRLGDCALCALGL